MPMKVNVIDIDGNGDHLYLHACSITHPDGKIERQYHGTHIYTHDCGITNVTNFFLDELGLVIDDNGILPQDVIQELASLIRFNATLDLSKKAKDEPKRTKKGSKRNSKGK
jgi:hypothetical protein